MKKMMKREKNQRDAGWAGLLWMKTAVWKLIQMTDEDFMKTKGATHARV